MRLLLSLLFALWALPVARAHAGASLWVDDAAITPAGHCQWESWWRGSGHAAELAAAPACAWASTEVGLTLRHGPGNAATTLALGVKHALRDPEQDGWDAALSLEASAQGRSPRYAENTFNLPLGFALDRQGRSLLHVDLGWSQPRSGRDARAWSAPPAAAGSGSATATANAPRCWPKPVCAMRSAARPAPTRWPGAAVRVRRRSG
ncbi:hypothetical protein [Xanthomonas theicola]|uniref:Uncharacterized protein n=1 Tax=Xanthomonas theicola TaxID=56464 RepID=A0A2S6ZE71_9XANT|nr:hypothetical protein [Xanthomonas theicola]PPT90564.1 hypothetical protein XthCFBP4691_11635 [Xanthomonas theicola]QNH24142.1 hypothetical protein G4Q83_04330 [Xanthomonas theicola]